MALEVFPGAVVLACPACGGTSWRPAGPDGERCITCRAWSPISVGTEDIKCNTTSNTTGARGTAIRMPEAWPRLARRAPQRSRQGNWVR